MFVLLSELFFSAVDVVKAIDPDYSAQQDFLLPVCHQIYL